MNNEETFDFEDRTYINPDLSRDEQTQFIETLRGMQDRNAQEIGRETYALGTNVPSNLGGLGGAEETWNARYQEPQMNEVAAQLKTAAQQTALNNALSNYSNMLQNRYNQAYRDYQKRQYNHQRNLEKSSTITNSTNPYTAPEGDVDANPTSEAVTFGEQDIVVGETTQSGAAPGTPAGDLVKNNATFSGGGVPAGRAGYSYIVEDKNGNQTAVRVYLNQNGQIIGGETAMQSFPNREAMNNTIGNIVRDGGKVLTTTGKEINTSFGWGHAMGENLF